MLLEGGGRLGADHKELPRMLRGLDSEDGHRVGLVAGDEEIR